MKAIKMPSWKDQLMRPSGLIKRVRRRKRICGENLEQGRKHFIGINIQNPSELLSDIVTKMQQTNKSRP